MKDLMASPLVSFLFYVFFFISLGLRAMETQGKPNHLLHEKSPYLIQHAYNPVDWYPWGEEAFAKARRENKPIFLSIGYSTCHWCHVMEKESFSDPKIAATMNKNFVSIKVDREERPDVDKIYMTAVQAMTGSGGWPLSVWLTPELKPFFGGTYFPPDSRWGRPGLPQTLEHLAQLWKTQREKIVSSSNNLNQQLVQHMTVSGRSGTLEPVALDNGFSSYQSSYDPSKGGFGGAPKFPMPVNHNFLLRYYARDQAGVPATPSQSSGTKGAPVARDERVGEEMVEARQSGNRTKEEKALEMSLHTLREMSKGGIYDHVGGGFHRYSTDEKWHIPHFEKMLYDNAQLAVNYLEAYQITREENFVQVVRETLEYVLRDMTHPHGGFYSAEDADSLPPELAGKVSDKGHEHKSEGAFYVWEKQEVLQIAGKEVGEIFSYRYGIEPSGNAESDPQGEFKNKNILYVAQGLSKTAKQFQKSDMEIKKILQAAKQKLFEARSKRPRPHRDDKILVSWNGLMISALAKASQILEDEKYLKGAEKAAQFIRDKLYDPVAKRLYRRWREGERKIPAISDDYAFLVQGLIDLYEASFDPRWLEWAITLTEEQNQLFYDPTNGGFYMTSIGHDKNLLVRTKEDSDNVEPSASSVATLNLLRLAQFTDRRDFPKMAEKTLALFAEQLKQQPRSLPQMLVSLDFYLSPHRQIVVAGDPKAPDTRQMLQLIHQRFMPNKILLLVDGGESQRKLTRWLPFLETISRVKDRTTAYVCVNYACELPTNDLKTLGLILDGKRPSQRK